MKRKPNINFLNFQVKRAYDHAYMVLTSAVSPLAVNRDSSRISILGRILRVTDEVIRYRKWVEQQFSVIPNSPILSPTINYNNQITSVRAPRSLSSSGSTSSVESGGSSEVYFKQLLIIFYFSPLLI